ncbi:hypothetical protein EUGRSUZ_H04277 [Eucalyptus grandis]|uniref:Uncharacterized protein n=1 Tax=Eucalyptus grandis TaxID=71139 RepID=A0ACC3JYQ9_EUCGR|nr:hypothetical protein EUGRSUZ_H04277 [Eucalyptus grandis]
MRGYQKIYNLEKKVKDLAIQGSLLLNASESKQSELGKSSSLSAAIAGARAAAIQYSKNQNHSTSYSTRINAMNIDTSRNVETASSDLEEVSDNSTPGDGEKEFSSYNETLTRERKQRAGPSSKIFGEAVRALKSS